VASSMRVNLQTCRERAHLDWFPNASVDLGRPTERGIQVVGVDDVKAAQVLPGVDEWAVGRQDLVVGDTYDRGHVGVMPRNRHRQASLFSFWRECAHILE